MTYEEMINNLAKIQNDIHMELYEQIKDIPEVMFFAIISMMIDHYIKDHSLNNREIWKMLYEVSGEIFEECGDYGDEVKS